MSRLRRRRREFWGEIGEQAMGRRQFSYALYALGFCLIALLSGPQAGAAGKQDWPACAARDIKTVIRGCTGIIEGKGESKARRIEAYLNRGKALAKRGSFAEAIADFDQVLRLSPGNAEAYRERGESHAERNEKAKAEADFTAVIGSSSNDAKTYAVLSGHYNARGWFLKTNGHNERAKADFEHAISLADKAIAAKEDIAKAHYYRAGALAGLGRYDQAISDYDKAIKLKPDDEAAYASRGIVYGLKGSKDQGITDLTKALDLQPGYWRGLNGRADLFIQKKDYEHAIGDCELAIKLSKDNAAAYNLRGYAYRSKGDNDRAIVDIDEAIRLSPNFAAAYANRGWAYSAKKDYERGVADFTRAIELNPKLTGAYNGRGQAYSDKKDFNRAIADLNVLIGIDPSSDNYVARGFVYARMGDNAKALADFSEAIRLNPDNWAAYSDRKAVYAKQGEYDKEIADIKEAIRLRPDDDTMHILLAQAYDGKKEYDRAIAVLDRLLQKKPDNYSAYTNRADFHINTKEYDAAISDVNEMIRLKPDDARGYSLRALVYTLKKAFDLAIPDITQAIRLEPDGFISDYSLRGSLYNLKGNYERAVADASEAIKLGLARMAEPDLKAELQQLYSFQVQTGYYERGIYRTNIGDFENALADFNEIIRLRPDSREGYRARAQFYYWQKQYDLVIPDADKALRLDPSDEIARTTKGLALLCLGKTREAAVEAEAGLRTGRKPDGYMALRAQIVYGQGKFAQALDDLNEAIKLAPFEYPTYYLYRGQAYEKLGQKALATADYKAAAGLEAPNPSQREARILARERLAALQGETLTAEQSAQPQRPPIDPGRRIALVIGAGAYEKAARLANPVSDAEAMADALRGLGFAEVIEVRDPGRASLEQAVKAFGDKAEQADWAAVFYAGHGIQVDGRNYLIPTDASLDNERHIEFETVSLDRILGSVAGAKKLALVILDSCRNNPFLSRMVRPGGRATRALGQGLAAIEPQQGQFVVYATKDGSTADDGEGDHSPFTKALLMHIGEAGLDIRLMFSKVRDTVLKITQNRQSPFTYGSLPGEGLYFKVAER
jgi:tetratricopeptide (TPR) repeat protein